MKHDFSIQDIVGALKKFRGIQNHYSDAQLAHLVDQARDINEVLHHLPEPFQSFEHDSEWELCAFADVEADDEAVLFEFKDGSKIQGKPDNRNDTDIDFWVGYELHTMSLSSFRKGKGVVYRIPKPVEHPEPEFHPVIYVPVREEGWVWDGEVYVCDSHGGHRGPGDFTDWEPAKIVPKNFVGDYPRRKLEYKGLPTAGDDQ